MGKPRRLWNGESLLQKRRGILGSLCGPRAPSPCKAIMGTESPKAKHYLTAVNTQGQQCPWGGLQATSIQDPCSPSYVLEAQEST